MSAIGRNDHRPLRRDAPTHRRTVRVGAVYEDSRYPRPWTFTVKPEGMSPSTHRYHRQDEAERMRDKVIAGVAKLGHTVELPELSAA